MARFSKAKVDAIEKAIRDLYASNTQATYDDYETATKLSQAGVRVFMDRLGIPRPLPSNDPSRFVKPTPHADPVPTAPVQAPPAEPASATQGEPVIPKVPEPSPSPVPPSASEPDGIGLLPPSQETPKAREEPLPAAPVTAPAPAPAKAQAPPQATPKAPAAPNPAPLIHQAMRQTAEVERRTVSLEQQVDAILVQLKAREQKPATAKAPPKEAEADMGALEENAEKAATGRIASSYATDVGTTARKTYDWDIKAGKLIREKWESTGYRAEFADPAAMAEEIFAFYADHRQSIQEFAEENERLKLRVEELERLAAPGYRAQLRTKALTEICIATKIAGGSFAPHEMAVVIQGLSEVLNGRE